MKIWIESKNWYLSTIVILLDGYAENQTRLLQLFFNYLIKDVCKDKIEIWKQKR